MAETYVGLLRGINVGGRNVLRMAELRSLREASGLVDVQTYIQSGNVVFRSDAADPGELARTIAGDVDAASKTLHLWFLADAPVDPDLARLEEVAAPTERFELAGRVFYLHAPDGIGRSKLAAQVERALDVPATARNGRTVAAVVALAETD
jgi:uncharacterized protein (DUF1697 family)